MISVRDLTKHYRVHQRQPGLAAALRSLVRRQYRVVKAVDGIAFDIAAGERVGFLGPNGAGKTTTLKVLSGLLHPTSGSVRIDGHEPHRREDAFLNKMMLVTGQKQQLLWDLPPSDTFELNRAIYDVPRPEFRRTVDELTELLKIADIVGTPTRQLSLGQRMKCELVAALIHRPRVLFLDEPTIGLDVAMQSVIRKFILEYNQRHSATIMLTSHYMDDVVALCPRVIVIDQGRLIYDGTLEELVRRVRPEKRIVFRSAQRVAREQLEAMGRVVSENGEQVVLQVPGERVNETVTRLLTSMDVTDLNVEAAPLEEIMSELFAGARPTA
jgi:ABC-2 type transport system ATP-binding protein